MFASTFNDVALGCAAIGVRQARALVYGATMIRDPSDGSVKETAGPAQISRPIGNAQVEPKSAGPASGLPFASTKPEQQARLERSREWLKDYRNSKPEGGENDATSSRS